MRRTTNAIHISVSEQVVKFKPGGAPATFDVVVVNQGDRFASFQLELEAPGADRRLGTRWYQLSQDSTKNPPGDRTEFRVSIIDTPIPGFVGTINLMVRVSSLELDQEARKNLRLILEPGKSTTPLQIDITPPLYKVTPGDLIEIPVRLNNLGQLLAKVILRCTGLEQSWLIKGSEQFTRVSPRGQSEVKFLCKIPSTAEALTQTTYPFTVSAIVLADDGNGNGNGSGDEETIAAEAKGEIEVLPSGYIEFFCIPNRQEIPSKPGFLDWRQDTATYQLQFKNESNLSHPATVTIEAWEDQPKCAWETTPDSIDLNPGETREIALHVRKRRHWFGLTKRCLLDVASVIDTPLDVRNDTQTIRLKVRPVLPVWLQALGSVGTLLLLWCLLVNVLTPHHREAVNSVQISGLGDRVISGSNDQSILGWRTEAFGNPFIAKSTGTIGKSDKAVRVVRFRPVNNDLIAAGLENGQVELWDAVSYRNERLQSYFNQKDDRVMDLAFTRDARYLFSGHGSGLVQQWEVDRGPGDSRTVINRPMQEKPFGFAIYALTVVGRPTDVQGSESLVVGGRFNRLRLWDWKKGTEQPIEYPAGSANDYILSLATAEYQPDLLAVSDNQGNLTLMSCVQNTCQARDNWRGNPDGKPIHAVALSANGCYLATAGDEGNLTVWALTSAGQRSTSTPDSQLVASVNTRLRSVALKQVNNELVIATGGDDRRVRVHRIKAFGKQCER